MRIVCLIVAMLWCSPALADLRSHYRGLARLGVTAARPQCETYFVPDDVVNRFRAMFSALPARHAPSDARNATASPEGV